MNTTPDSCMRPLLTGGKFAAVTAALVVVSCGRDGGAPVLRQTTAMNTYVNITVYDDLPREHVDGAIDSAIAAIEHIEDIASDYTDSSEVGRINAASGDHPVTVSQDLLGVIRKSLAYGDSTGGMFDVTIGPLEKAWDFLAEHPRVPSPDVIASLLPLINYRSVDLVDGTVYLPRRGMALDLGAIGKGFAVEKACGVLRQQGMKRFIVDLGGSLGVEWEGTHAFDSTAVTVSIRHPRKEGEFLASFRFGSGSVSTSGDYQRYFIVGDKRYHHILNPHTGYPIDNVVSVTVVTDNATEADAYSTIVFALGRTKGLEYIRKTPGLEGIIVTQAGDSLHIDCSPAFEGKLMFEPTSQ